MRRSLSLAFGILSLVLLTGCAATATDRVGSTPLATSEPTAASADPNAAAQAQAEAWLEAAALPPGATRSPGASGPFNSYQGWPCRPVAEIEAYWTIPGATVAETANWLMANPTADLVSTAVGPVPDDESLTSATVGYQPADESQQGVVYTIVKTGGGAVAVRAEIAALTEDAVCDPLPPGGTWGKPGQG